MQPLRGYNFITIQNAESGRKWLDALLHKIGTVNSVAAGSETDMRWVTVAFTFNGLRKLGLDEASLATFPEPFKQGMAARAQCLEIQEKIIRIIGKTILPVQICMQ